MPLRLSVMIPTYNCARLLEQTLRSVLAEGLSGDDAEIVVVDDVSTKDDPERVVREVGRDRVGFVRQARNGGAIKNFNTCVRLARGELVHNLHGDDFVLPGFYGAVLGHADRFPEVGLVCTRSFIVDEAGEIDWLSPRLRHLEAPSREVRSLIYGGNLIQTPSVVIRKVVYTRFGYFDESLVHVADWEMWVRAVATSAGVCVNRPLAAYRVFAGQDTARLRLTGENIRDHLRLCDRWSAVLPGFDRAAFLRMVEAAAARQVADLTAKGLADAAEANARIRDEIRVRLGQLG
jgi:glycosyltransferase involved in cell wall biosynthesis